MTATSLQALQDFQNTPFETLAEEIGQGKRDEDLRQFFGEELANEMRHMAASRNVRVLSSVRPHVILLPGIMGSTLRSTQGELGLIWINPIALKLGKLPLMRLAPDGRSDAEAVTIMASGLWPLTYLPLYLHLRWSGCEVWRFPFDWRQTPADSAQTLHAFLKRQQNNSPVHLVSHSMGGLVARHYCRLYPEEARNIIAQIVMLGTPNYGSFEAVRNLSVGGEVLRLMHRLNPANQPLRVARTFPGLYSLLPAPQATYPEQADFPYPFSEEFDCYDINSYKIRDINPIHLARARTQFEDLVDAPLPVPVSIIAGCHLPTQVKVTTTNLADRQVSFAFDTSQQQDGDGTVPLASAVALPGASCFYVKRGEHSGLPKYPGVRCAIEALVFGEEPDLPPSVPPKVMSAQDLADIAGISNAPLPGTLSEANLDMLAARIQLGQTTPEDLALLSRPL